MTAAQKKALKQEIADLCAQALKLGLDSHADVGVRHQKGDTFVHVQVRDNAAAGPTWFQVSVKESF